MKETVDQKLIGTPRRIILYGNPLLRQVARKVTAIDADLLRLIADLKATMLRCNGIGLAANQIGVQLAVFTLAPQEADVDLPTTAIINPEIVATEGTVETEEGCLSIPEIFEVVPRPEMVIIRGVTPEGKETQIEASGLLARAIVHEIEHLQGILFIDHLSELRLKLLQQRLAAIEKMEKQQCG